VVEPARRGPGGKGAGLVPREIVATALALLDEHGVEWLTMRKLAAALHVSVGALYWHFPNRDSLLAAVVDDVALELRWDPSAPGTERERLVRHLTVLRAHWRRHPVLVSLGRRFRPGESGAFSADGMAILRDLGFDADEARTHWRALVWLVLGFFFVEEAVHGSTHHQPVGGLPGLYQVSFGGEPEIIDTDALFDHVLGLALDGVEHAAPLRRP
jgi:AcrR family transcriptional regulator